MLYVPEVLFGLVGGKDAESKYKELLKTVHPDVCKDRLANDIFIKVQEARREYVERERNGLLRNITGKVISDERNILVTSNKSFFEFDSNKVPDHASVSTYKPTYASEHIRTQISPILPTFPITTKTGLGKVQFSIPHNEDIYPLSFIKKHFTIQDADKLWITSSLLNVICFFKVTHKVLLDITMDNIYLNPIKHEAHFIGGWWYSSKEGDKLTVVPKNTYDILPYSIKMNKIAEPGIMTLQVKKIICDLGIDNFNETIVSYMRDVIAVDPIKAYKEWQDKVLPSYGVRKFYTDGLTKDFIKGF